jgi:hypothetical protein
MYEMKRMVVVLSTKSEVGLAVGKVVNCRISTATALLNR